MEVLSGIVGGCGSISILIVGEAVMHSAYVDVHCHLTESAYELDLAAVIERAASRGVTQLVVNGVDPASNRKILEMQQQYPTVRAAVGIYPIQAVSRHLSQLPMPIEVLQDPDAEIRFIAEQAQAGTIVAIGECGLDAHWLGPETFAEQERVFLALVDVAKQQDLPVIVHSRKLEMRTYELLREANPGRVVFHCWGGRVKQAIEIAQLHPGWAFSIPANARRNGAFEKMLRELPETSLLTETDSPYLSPLPATRNEPQNVVDTIEFLAALRNWKVETAKDLVWRNFCRIFTI